MNTLQLAKIKQHLLQEIGDASKAPYSPIDTISDTDDEREYGFSTSEDPSGIRYQVNVVTFYRGPMDPVIARVNFGTITDDGDINYDTQTNKNDIYRVMATIVSIVKRDLKSNHADIIEFSPTKRTVKQNSKRAKAGIQVDTDLMNNARTQLYLRYIKGQFRDGEFKDSQVTETPDGDIKVDLQNRKPNQ
jgi:hypothetical protein